MNNKVDNCGNPICKEAKEWPLNSEMAKFGEIVDPLREALQIALNKGDKVYSEGIEWTGLKQGKGNPIFHPPRSLHSIGLSECKEHQNRDVFTEILSIAVQLGIEQGKRELKTELKEISFMLTSKHGEEMLQKILQ